MRSWLRVDPFHPFIRRSTQSGTVIASALSFFSKLLSRVVVSPHNANHLIFRPEYAILRPNAGLESPVPDDSFSG